MIEGRSYLLVLGGALTGVAVGTLLGGALLPALTADWLFTTSADNIRVVSLPALAVLGLWVGAVAGDLLAGVHLPESRKAARRSRWSLCLGIAALLLGGLLCWPEPLGAVHRLLSQTMARGTPNFVPLWLVLVNALGAGSLATLLGWGGARRVNTVNRRTAILGSVSGVVSLCLVLSWLALGGAFALFWDI